MTAPSAETTLDSAPNGSNDWYTTSPAWTTNGEDDLSGLVSDPCQTGTYSGPEGTGLTVSGTCSDNAGNTASDDSPPFKYDGTGPSAALTVTAGTLGSNGWYTSDVTVSTDGTDSISGPATCTLDQSPDDGDGGARVQRLLHERRGSDDQRGSAHGEARQDRSVARRLRSGRNAGAQRLVHERRDNQHRLEDSISSPVTCTPDQHQTTETAGTTFNGSCTNDAGLTTNAAPLTVKLDKTRPDRGPGGHGRTLGTNGWYTSDVTVGTDGHATRSATR